MKKALLLVLITTVLSVILTACEESPGIEYSSLPSDFYVQKAKESGDFLYTSEVEIEISTPSVDYPIGDYLLLENQYGTNLFSLSYFSDSEKVCTLDSTITNPSLFEERTSRRELCWYG